MFNSSRLLVGAMSMHQITVALTGSPGTGKSTLASRLKQHGIHIISLEQVAEAVDALSKSHQTLEVETSKLGNWSWDGDQFCIIDGHLSHHCCIDAVIILRCHPSKLRQRLEQREGYGSDKIESNIEWELLSGVWSELIVLHPHVKVIEIDTTHANVPIEPILDFLTNPRHSKTVEEYIQESIDWIGNGNVAESI